ncbi:MAG: SprT family zinc-dependent metalloprotease [Humidesulfovibrio sp.]|nr:SprT family zinc-dependent metalloprotease [Humidesulfovibrio sp.]
MTPDHIEITAGDERIAVELSFDRFRSLRISVRPEGVVRVRAPLGASLRFVRESVQAKAVWIARHLERFRAVRPVRCLEYAHGEPHAFLGREYCLDVRCGPGPRGVCLADDRLEIACRIPPEPERVRKLLDAWYMEQAREVFARVIRELLPRFDALGVPRPTKLKVRAMTSRWGTCSRAGVITLNRHLVKAALPCVEYVAAHELCHLRHHGHDARFYGLLAAILPDWKQRRARLRREVVL